MDQVKKFFGGVGEFFTGFGKVLIALASSRKAVLTFAAVVVTVGSQLFPDYQELLAKAVPYVDGLLAILVAAIAFEDGLKGKAAGG